MDLLKNNLPDVLASFLDRGEISITAATRPSWLLNEFEASRWLIKIPGQSHFFEGRWHEALAIDWELKLPKGLLTDPQWLHPLTHAKLLAIAFLEAPSATTTTPKALESFCSVLMALCEHLIVHYPDRVAENGFSFISTTEIERFCADYMVLGMPGTGAWLHRLRSYMRKLIELRELEFRFGSYKFSPLGNNAFPSSDFLVEGLTIDEIEKLVLRLRELNWFSSTGKVSLIKIADAIRVDLTRIGKLRRKLGYFLSVIEHHNQPNNSKKIEPKRRARVGVRQQLAQLRLNEGSKPNSQRRVFELMCELPNLSKFILPLKDSLLTQSDFLQLNSILHGGTVGRTPTLPVPIALFIYDRMLHWVLNYTMPLLSYVGDVIEQYLSMPPARYGVNEGNVFKKNPPPAVLQPLKIDRFGAAANSKSSIRYFWCESGEEKETEPEYHGMGLMDALRLNFAALVGLTAAFTMRRIGEIVRLDIFSMNEVNGRCYLEIECEKKGGVGVNPKIRRPIPRILYEGLSLQLQFTLRLRELDKNNDSKFDNRLWKLINNRLGMSALYFSPKTVAINESLDMFCDWIRVPLDETGSRWYLRLHECRRFGALSFFRLSGQENSLPTLSWFLGHSDICHTWRYIKEDLTGGEITETEAAMAKEAIMAYQASDANEGVTELRKILQKHFNAERLDLIANEDVDEFLKLKHKEGLYKVFPRSIVTADGQQTVIVIQLSKVTHAATNQG